jgi:general stress protein YciG
MANKRKDPDFYRKIGRIGGSAKTNKPRGFAIDRERAARAGKIGGTISRRTYVKNGEGKK